MVESVLKVAGTAWPTEVLMLALRLGALLLLTPLLYAFAIPATVRMLIVLGLAVALSMGIPASASEMPSTLGGLLRSSVQELALGATLGLGILLAFGAVSVAGRLLDIQIGFGIAQVFDPLSRSQLPILTSTFNQVAVLMFFLVDGHHALLRAVAYSLERFPLGKPWPLSEAMLPILKQAAGLFSLGFALAAPVVFCLAMVELALGVIARNLPQMNMFVLGIPIKIIAGLMALSLWFAGIGGVMTRVYAGIYENWSAVFASSPLASRSAAEPGRSR